MLGLPARSGLRVESLKTKEPFDGRFGIDRARHLFGVRVSDRTRDVLPLDFDQRQGLGLSRTRRRHGRFGRRICAKRVRASLEGDVVSQPPAP
jgi:hypothetical protein